MRAVWLCLLAVVTLSGCVNHLTGDTYSRDEARRQMQVYYGTVVSAQPKVIEGNRNEAGSLGGAVIGGLAGNTMGGGRGTALTTAIGAIGGAVAGSAVQERATRAQGLEIVLRMDDGREISVVQEVENIQQFYPGQRVRLTVNGGASRVSPL